MDWDLTPYFDTFGSPAYKQFKTALADDLTVLLDELANAPALTAETGDAWADRVNRVEALISRSQHISSYLGCLASADARNEDYSADEAWYSELEASFQKLRHLLSSALGEASEDDFTRLVAHPAMCGAEFHLRQERAVSLKKMSGPEEALAADLSVNGSKAWSRLYFNLVGKLTFELQNADGTTRTVPYSQRVSLISGSDRAVRRAAFVGANKALAEHETTFATALNSLAGERLLLNKQRGIDHFLDVSCRGARLTRTTLDALMEAIRQRQELAREVLRFRTRTAAISDPSFFDLYAPLPDRTGAGESTIPWEKATTMVEEAFRGAYPEFGAFFADMLAKRWIDYHPRDGKRPGGFCTSAHGIGESRIFMTYQGTMNDIMTLAHEAGHAWHSHVLNDYRYFATEYPMTLAESASTFGEMILSEGILTDAGVSEADKLKILDADTERAIAFFLDIPMRFHFERKFYEERKSGTVSISQIKELMTETQREIFGDTLCESGLDPYFWTSKLHFYIDEVLFYNYPYAFGYTLSLALFSRFREEGASFLPSYRKFLEQTGSKSCEDVIRDNLGEDITQPEFWTRAIDQIRTPFTRLQDVVSVR